MTTTVEITTDNLDAEIDEYKRRGYRLDMIIPADQPREALVSRDGESVRLVRSSRFSGPPVGGPTKVGTPNEWITGRAGMEYRDLIPGRFGGKVIASHIRLTKGGEVPDYVHYHKVQFQMIYCLAGAIRVVYEDQGEPFWLNPGDCVLQPPEIRHRVLECTAGSEVIEISMPSEHETWVEHEIELPTSELRPDRDFGGQRFHRHIAADAGLTESDDGTFLLRDLGLAAPSTVATASIIRSAASGTSIRPKVDGVSSSSIEFFSILAGDLTLNSCPDAPIMLKPGDGFVAPYLSSYVLDCSTDIEFLQVQISG